MLDLSPNKGRKDTVVSNSKNKVNSSISSIDTSNSEEEHINNVPQKNPDNVNMNETQLETTSVARNQEAL